MPQRSFLRERTYLLPPSVDEWIPATHPVRFIAMLVEELPDESWATLEIDREPDPRGAPRYAPEVLLSVWLAGFTLGISTTRKLEYACQYDLAFVWLAAGQRPDHHTLWRFYDQHRHQLRGLLKQTVKIAIEANLLDLALQAVDGTKVLANAARERSLTVAELESLEQKLETRIAQLESQQQGDADPPPPELPKELAQTETLRARVRNAQAKIVDREQPGKVNLTDPDARGMKTRQGLHHAYNAQAVVVALDAERSGCPGRIVLAAEVTTDPDDHGQLERMVAAAHAEAPVALTVADAGYHSAANLAVCAERGWPVVMPETNPPSRRTQPLPVEVFTYDAEQDGYVCPQGTLLPRRSQSTSATGRTQVTYRAARTSCQACPVRPLCIPSGRGGRRLTVSGYDQQLRQHRRMMETREARQVVRRRKGLIEGVFGTVKERYGGRRVRVRGLAKVAAEWTMQAIGVNLRTLARVWALHHGDAAPAGAAGRSRPTSDQATGRIAQTARPPRSPHPPIRTSYPHQLAKIKRHPPEVCIYALGRFWAWRMVRARSEPPPDSSTIG